MPVAREKVIQAAEKYVSRGRIDAAIKEYRKLLAENPNDANTLNRVGDLYARLNQPEEAIRLFSQIAEQYTEDGFFVKAIAIYKKIIKLDPTQLEVYEQLAALYHRQGLINEARGQYQVLADYYLKHRNAGSAVAIHRRMAELEPENPSPRVKLAELFLDQGLTSQALGEYRKIAELMVAKGHAAEAAQVYHRALDLDPTDLGFITDAVLQLKNAGHAEAAEKLLAEAIERNPGAERIGRVARLEEREHEGPAVSEATAAAVAGEEPGWEVVEEVEEGVSEEEAAATGPEAAAAEEPAAVAPEAEGTEEDVYILDLDGEGPPASLVEPAAEEEAAAASRGREAAPADERQADFEFELDLDELEEELAADRASDEPGEEVAVGEPEEAVAEAAPSEPAPAPPAERTPTVEIDAEVLERTAAEIQPVQIRREEDLVAEAEVLAKYGLEGKALERLREVLQINPRHLDAHAVMIALHLRQARHERVSELAERMAAAAKELGRRSAWMKVRGKLERAGYRFEGDRVAATPIMEAAEDQVEKLLHGLLEEPAPPPTARRRAGRKGAVPPPKAAAEAPPPAAPVPAPPASPPAAASRRDQVAPSSPAPGPPASPPDLSWLDRVEAAPTPADSGEKLFAEEEQFFDLAAELEKELLEEDQSLAGGELLPQPEEPSLEEIVEGFKRGVAESLSPEDYDTHFNLGIAYREMGLLDEAIGEFQLAAKDLRYLVDCCALLGVCFLEKGLPELAIKWYKKGLAVPHITEDAMLGLLYDLGSAHLAAGDREGAYQAFVEIYGVNSNYRDVVARVEELGGRRGTS